MDRSKIQVVIDGNTMSLDYNPDRPIRLQDMLCALEREILIHVLVSKQNVKARAAESLCLLRTTLVEKVKKYEIKI